MHGTLELTSALVPVGWLIVTLLVVAAVALLVLRDRSRARSAVSTTPAAPVDAAAGPPSATARRAA